MSNDFSTIDRLIEFGMGTAIATQMIQTMNQSMSRMNVAGVNAAPHVGAMPRQGYYAVIDGRQAGPLSTDDIQTLVDRELITADVLMWRPGMTGWMRACDIPEVNRSLLLKR